MKAISDLFVRKLGYEHEQSLGINPTAQEMRIGLRKFCEACSPKDVVVLYHTGHAIIENGRHRLWMGDTADSYSTTLPTADLVEVMLAETPVAHLLIIIDACLAGHGAAEAAVTGMQAFQQAGDRTVTLITAAHPTEEVLAGDFVRLFVEAMDHPATGGREPEFLSVDAIVSHIDANPLRPAWQTISWTPLFRHNEEELFLPNPRYDPTIQRLDVLTQRLIEQNKLRRQDFLSHFLPRAQGVDVPTESDWRFVGRHNALRDLVGWLQDSSKGPVKVVTGDPGSGKSALIGRLVTFSNPGRRSSVPPR